MRIDIRGVLAGAYKNQRLDKCLNHAVEVDADGREVRVLCGRVKLDHIVDKYEESGPLTCATCAKRLARL